MRKFIPMVGIWMLLLATSTFGLERTYVVHMTGAQEVAPPGDPDGIADGIITLNDVTGLVSWSFTYANIAAPTLMHIHTGAAGVSGGILISLGVATSGGAGTLISSTVHGNLAQVTSVLANPQGFYVNIHNAPFGSGAVRGQIGCNDNGDCDDTLFCTGVETCGADNLCVAGTSPCLFCAGEICNETTNACDPGNPPCGNQTCHEDTDRCPAMSTVGVAIFATFLSGLGAIVIRRRMPKQIA